MNNDEINSLKRWIEKDFSDLRNELERLDYAIYGDSRERNGSGVVPLARRIQKRMEEIDEKVDALRLVTIRQGYLLLVVAIVEFLLVMGILAVVVLVGSLL